MSAFHSNCPVTGKMICKAKPCLSALVKRNKSSGVYIPVENPHILKFVQALYEGSKTEFKESKQDLTSTGIPDRKLIENSLPVLADQDFQVLNEDHLATLGLNAPPINVCTVALDVSKKRGGGGETGYDIGLPTQKVKKPKITDPKDVLLRRDAPPDSAGSSDMQTAFRERPKFKAYGLSLESLVCNVCGQADPKHGQAKMIRCHDCGKGYHLGSCIPAGLGALKHTWQCNDCRACSFCFFKLTSRSPGTSLLQPQAQWKSCYICDRSFHDVCLSGGKAALQDDGKFRCEYC
jgi:hypothetical protein